jgi:hypothetical protein
MAVLEAGVDEFEDAQRVEASLARSLAVGKSLLVALIATGTPSASRRPRYTVVSAPS